MKRALLFASTLLLAATLPTIALANCSTTNMAGVWRLLVLGDDGMDFCLMTLSAAGKATGTCLVDGAFGGALNLNTACKITGKIDGKALTGRTEVIAANSPLKPNLMSVYIPNGHAYVQGFRN